MLLVRLRLAAGSPGTSRLSLPPDTAHHPRTRLAVLLSEVLQSLCAAPNTHWGPAGWAADTASLGPAGLSLPPVRHG